MTNFDFTNCKGPLNFAVCGDVPRFYQENWSEIEKSLDKTGIGMSGAEIVVHLRYIYFCNCPLKCIAVLLGSEKQVGPNKRVGWK